MQEQTRTSHVVPVSADMAELEGAINEESKKIHPEFDMFLWDARYKVRRVQSHMKFENKQSAEILEKLNDIKAMLKPIGVDTFPASLEISDIIGRISSMMEMR